MPLVPCNRSAHRVAALVSSSSRTCSTSMDGGGTDSSPFHVGMWRLRSCTWLLQLRCLLQRAPLAPECSTECRQPVAARRSRAIDIDYLFFMCSRREPQALEVGSCSALVTTGCHRRPVGTSDDLGRLAGAIGDVCMCRECVGQVCPFTMKRMSNKSFFLLNISSLSTDANRHGR